MLVGSHKHATRREQVQAVSRSGYFTVGIQAARRSTADCRSRLSIISVTVWM